MLRNYAVLHDAALLHQEQSQGEPRAKWLPWPQAEQRMFTAAQETPATLRDLKNHSLHQTALGCFGGNQRYFLLPLISMAPWPLVFDRRRRSRSRSRSGSLIAGVVRRQRCQRICRCSTATKAVAETAGGDWRSVREITGKLWNRELSSSAGSAVVLVWPNQAFLCAQVKMSCWVHQMRFQKEFGDQHFQRPASEIWDTLHAPSFQVAGEWLASVCWLVYWVYWSTIPSLSCRYGRSVLVMEVVDLDKQLWEVKAARGVILVFRLNPVAARCWEAPACHWIVSQHLASVCYAFERQSLSAKNMLEAERMEVLGNACRELASSRYCQWA